MGCSGFTLICLSWWEELQIFFMIFGLPLLLITGSIILIVRALTRKNTR